MKEAPTDQNAMSRESSSVGDGGEAEAETSSRQGEATSDHVEGVSSTAAGNHEPPVPMSDSQLSTNTMDWHKPNDEEKKSGLTDNEMARIKEEAKLTQLSPAATLVLQDYDDSKNQQTGATTPQTQNQKLPAIQRPKAGSRPLLPRRKPSNHQRHQLRQFQGKTSTPDDEQSKSSNRGNECMDEIKEQERLTRLNPAVSLALGEAFHKKAPSQVHNHEAEKPRAAKMPADSEKDWREQFSLMDDSGGEQQERMRNHASTPLLAQPGNPQDTVDNLIKSLARHPSDYGSDYGSDISDEFARQQIAMQSSAAPSVCLEGEEKEELSDENNSQYAKNRIDGPVQPGAYGAAPGVKPSRIAPLRFSALIRASAENEDSGQLLPNKRLHDDLEAARLELGGSIQSSIDSKAHSATEELTSQRNQGLVKARLVESMMEIDIHASEYKSPSPEAAATKVQRQRYELTRSYAVLFLGFALFVLLMLAATGTIFPGDPPLPPSEMPSQSPTLAPTMYEYTLELPAYTIKAIQADHFSPQALAYAWIQNDTLLENYSPYQQLQRFTLVTLYIATNGEAWTINENWLSHAHHECEWQTKGLSWGGTGFVISTSCDSDGSLLYLRLTKNGLFGTLPPEVAFLTKLEVLDLASNNIRGRVPTQIGQMTALRELILDFNKLRGLVPSELAHLTLLEYFYIHNNPVTGTLMTELGLLTNMVDLQWAVTSTRGSIPTEIGLMTQLTNLILGANMLEGSLPSELGSLTKISWGFGAYGQFLTGVIPSELWRISNVKSFHLDDNSLTGSLSSEIGLLSRAQGIYLNSNNMEGNIPSTLGLLSSSLQFLDLSANAGISGSIPSELGGMTSLTWLDLDRTNLSGSLPVELTNLAVNGSLSKLLLNDTFVTGEIPSQLCSFEELHFDCSSNLCGCFCVCLFTAQDKRESLLGRSVHEQLIFP
ncbi:Leucine Rich Repeat [Seminavis robusta]|uniref:Leucine Rich Repeat n=1 Tax=Seminavis robusta TaxID=568900 RepID=A0A9N8HQ55_9STRA|nr:Leucine Rich Repeat [Seminavis robusta]|eukprot:Sro954_g224280.1 Leucine Rich Repeat (941) ;mRNA; r:4257-7079